MRTFLYRLYKIVKSISRKIRIEEVKKVAETALSKNDKNCLFFENKPYICISKPNEKHMQNKKSLLQRLLVIYITFFIVLVASIAHGILPNFTRGAAEGVEMGNDIAEMWRKGAPRMIYMLSDIRITGQPDNTVGIVAAAGTEISADVSRMNLVIRQDAPDSSVFSLAFRSIGGSAWLYALVMFCPILFAAIIVLMFVIIHSLRRSIREERTLDRRNVWWLRAIGLLTILTELIHDIVNWVMNSRAAELLAGSGYSVDTGFHVSYSMIIMGILILFAAEVFAIGQNLSEEQKLTI